MPLVRPGGEVRREGPRMDEYGIGVDDRVLLDDVALASRNADEDKTPESLETRDRLGRECYGQDDVTVRDLG